MLAETFRPLIDFIQKSVRISFFRSIYMQEQIIKFRNTHKYSSASYVGRNVTHFNESVQMMTFLIVYCIVLFQLY